MDILVILGLLFLLLVVVVLLANKRYPTRQEVHDITIRGKQNQVSVEQNGQTILKMPQDLDCGASPTFGCLTIDKIT